MNEEQENLLENFLNSELDDYGLSWEYAEREQKKYEIRVILNGEQKCVELFKIKVIEKFRGGKHISLFINMGDDNWQEISEDESSVRYFWMKVAPAIWGNK